MSRVVLADLRASQSPLRSGLFDFSQKQIWFSRCSSAATVEVAASLDYVLLAVPWPNVKDALRSLPAWNGRVLIDATNPFSEYSPNLVLADLGGKGASEIVAGFAPARPRRQGIQLDHYRTFQRRTHEEQRPSRDFCLGRRARADDVVIFQLRCEVPRLNGRREGCVTNRSAVAILT